MPAEAFWFITYLTTPLPEGSFSPLEADSSFADASSSGEFLGGLCTVQVVRYSDTPVGPYDELLIVPGRFSPERKVRITRIYVSTAGSVYNGRRNWNIPKTLAEFTFYPTPSPDSVLPYSRIDVSSSPGGEIFFSARLDAMWTRGWGVPFSTRVMGMVMDIELLQPPLPKGEREEMVGTEGWIGIVPGLSGSVVGFRASGGLGDKFGDGVGFPDVGFWRWGMWWRGLTVDFGVGREVVVGKKRV